MTIRIGIVGASGRMGRAVIQILSRQQEALRLVSAYSRPGSSSIDADAGTLAGGEPADVRVSDDLSQVTQTADVVIDFSRPGVLMETVAQCLEQNKPLVSGTTGLSGDERLRLADAAKRIPIVYAPNTSVGVNLVLRALAMIAERLGEEYGVEISEVHHRHKVDAPSGTALQMGEVVSAAGGKKPEEVVVYDDGSADLEHIKGAIVIRSQRIGEVVGEHTVSFADDYECIEVSHRAKDRAAFAAGAVRAALWVADKPPGLYAMQDVLGL